MSESHRDQDLQSNISSSQNHRNSKDLSDRHHRKRSHVEMDSIDAKIYIGNVPTEKLSDEELLDFFKTFGKVSDIRVFKDHIFVQYNRIDDANKLLNQSKTSLMLKGHKLDVLPARDVRSTSTKSSSTDRSLKRRSHERNFHGRSSNGESAKKRTNFDQLESNSNEILPRYSILSGSKNTNDLIDCQIIIVNHRQREYAEEIESRLHSHGLITSIILLREDYTLVEAIENATRLNCLYGIIIMPMHEERRTASFHILYGQTEEHRNLTLDDGIHIILTNFIAYKERLQNDKINPYRESVIYSESPPSSEYIDQTTNSHHNNVNPPLLTVTDKLPLSMLLCLLADGRQLTLEEIDRVLVYLLEKKAKMLTLPSGTLPPLPAQYARLNHHTGSNVQPVSSPTSGADVSSTLAEQIRQFLATNIVKSNSSTTDAALPTSLSTQHSLSDIVKHENGTISNTTNEFIQAQRQPTQTPFVFPKNEALPVVIPPFNYPSTTGSVSSYPTTNFSYSSMTTPKSTPSVPVQNYLSQPSSLFYPSGLNSISSDATAAILQAYSQFNVQSTATTPTLLHQPLTTTQHQLRK